ncbi:hypothetical protein MHYP_G00071220 [Metynnis hypsauchen]
MTRETENETPDSGAVFTFGKSEIADNVPSKFWLKNDKPVHISCGHSHSAFVTEHGRLFVFGSNNRGQLGLETKGPITKPVCVKALKGERAQFAACGTNHTIVSTSQGEIFATGRNSEGQLGLGHCDDRTSFEQLHPFCDRAPIKLLSAGCNTSAALTVDGRLFLWGDNSVGQLGLGSEKHVLLPQELKVGRPIVCVSCGSSHSAINTDTGDVFTFGETADGRLGLSADQLVNHRQPQQVGTLEGVLQVACGSTHTLALTENKLYAFGRDSGFLYTFGDGHHGKLGLGDENFTNQFTPTVSQRFLDYTVMAVACGSSHTLVFAHLRHQESEEVCLEDGDVTYPCLDRCYTSMLMGQTVKDVHEPTSTPASQPFIFPASLPASHRWSLSARSRRRQRGSLEQFGACFRNLPPLTTGLISQNILLPKPPPRTSKRHSYSHLPTDGSTEALNQNGTCFINTNPCTSSDKSVNNITEHRQDFRGPHELSPSNKMV